MRITIEIPYNNVQRQFLKVGDGMLATKTHEVLNRFYAKIVEIEMTKEEEEQASGGGGFKAG